MTYTIQIEPRVQRDLRRIDRQHQSKILAEMNALSQDPRPHGSKKIEPKSANLYVARAGIHFRILYAIDDAAKVVRVIEVGPRENFY